MFRVLFVVVIGVFCVMMHEYVCLTYYGSQWGPSTVGYHILQNTFLCSTEEENSLEQHESE